MSAGAGASPGAKAVNLTDLKFTIFDSPIHARMTEPQTLTYATFACTDTPIPLCRLDYKDLQSS